MSDKIKLVKVAEGVRVVREGAAAAGVAQAEAERANQFKQAAAGSAAMALAIFGSAQALQDALATAQAQASLAAGHAASAGSVAQQDLSGVTAAPLHRSPNAVVAQDIYDTRNDSDGGAWTQKVDASYLYETLNGKWLGPQASEAAARAVAGATGDYFQLSTDGKFYRLSAGAGVTETFRGNKARFPRMAAYVVENWRVVIYDLLEPGRPMWGVLLAGGNNWLLSGVSNVTSVAAREGWIAIGGNVGVTVVSVAGDWALNYEPSGIYRLRGTFVQRNAALGYDKVSTTSTASNSVNALAMTTMPDAPVDPVTGLQAPTIAVATAGGVSVIKHDGSVVTGPAGSYASVQITPHLLTAQQNSVFFYASKPAALGSAFTLQTLAAGTAPAFNPAVNMAGIVMPRRDIVGARGNSFGQPPMRLMKFNEMNPAASLVAYITDAYNTGWLSGGGVRCMFADVSAGAAAGGQVADRSYKAKPATIFGTLTKTAVATAAQLVFWSGFSASNYAQEAYSADLDFGTGGFALPVWAQIPSVLPASNFPTTGAEKITNGDFSAGLTGWTQTVGTNGNISVDGLGRCAIQVTSGFAVSQITQTFGSEFAGKALRITVDVDKTALARPRVNVVLTPFVALAQVDLPAGNNQTVDFVIPNGTTSVAVNFSNPGSGGGGDGTVYFDNISVKELLPACIAERSAAGGGASWKVGVWPNGAPMVEVVDSAGVRRSATSSASYAGGPPVLLEPSLTTSGTLTLKVGGEVAGQTTGAPLASLSNASAVMTWGNSRTLDAPFPGGIALARPTATIPSDDASRFIYQQEKAMFRDGAQVALPDAGLLVDLAYDQALDCWRAVSAANESEFRGLVRSASSPVSAGSHSKIAAASGIKLVARTTTNPGVDVTMPSQNLKEELLRRAEELVRLQTPLPPTDWQGAFTATIINGSCLATITGNSLQLPPGATLQGARVGGAGVAAGATVLAVVGNQVQLSAPCTATNASAIITIQDLILPPGQSPHLVCTSGAAVQEGTGKVWNRAFDGFRERVAFGSPPGNLWIQVETRRAS